MPIKLFNWWMAKKCARQHGQEECERLVAQYQVVVLDGMVTEGGEVYWAGNSLTPGWTTTSILHLQVHIKKQQV